MPSTVYIITNKINLKRYVGMTSRPIHIRWGEHTRHYVYEESKLLYRAMRKYGLENFDFEIHSVVSEHEEAALIEQQLIFELDTHCQRGHGYNTTDGGEGTPGLSRFGRSNSFFGKTHSKETKDRLRSIHIGRRCSEQARQAMSRAQIGRKWSDSHRENALKACRRNVYEIYTPDGQTLKTDSLSAFAKKHGLQQSELSRVANGKSNHHRGYRVKRL